MAAQVLSVDREFRYIIMWFNEWSELQREDFVPILVEYLTQSSSCDSNGIYVNGLVNAVNNVDISANKPMSLFQCRIKLFREWSSKWPLDFKQKLREKIFEIDGKVGEKVTNELKTTHNDTHSNGNTEIDDAVTVNGGLATAAVTDDIVNAAVAIVNETEEAIMSDNRLAAVLNNETSVDAVDDESNDKDADNGNDAQENGAHMIELAGQVQAQPEHAIVISAQTVLDNSAEVPFFS